VSRRLAAGANFQFRNDGSQPLDIIAATMPPWPGDGEAYPVDGKWEPTV
jgi:mannose-6-phosphate isomerase-like protein (cupin superfamily)